MFLNLTDKSIGQIGGGKSERSGTVDIAIIHGAIGYRIGAAVADEPSSRD